MEQYKQEFIEFMIDCNVLKFGDFVTKSGRKTPFFVNTGFYRTGAQLRKLGQYYAKAIESKFGLDFDVLFGPGIQGNSADCCSDNGNQRGVWQGYPLLLQS